MQKLILFNNFCKNFQGKFFFKGLHQFSTINCTYSYKSLPLGIFLNSYLVKAHCGFMQVRCLKNAKESLHRLELEAQKTLDNIEDARREIGLLSDVVEPFSHVFRSDSDHDASYDGPFTVKMLFPAQKGEFIMRCHQINAQKFSCG